MNRLGINILFILLLSGLHLAQAAGIAVIIKMKGQVEMQTPGAKNWQGAKKGQLLAPGVKVRTGSAGLAMIKYLDDKSFLRMKPKSFLTIVSKEGEGKEVAMGSGSVFFHIKKKEKQGQFNIKTPTSVATVKGTQFWIVVEENGKTMVVTLENFVELLNIATGKSLTVGPGQTGVSDEKGVTVRDTKPEDTGQKQATQNELKIKFKDSDGNPKDLIIEYEKKP